MTQLCSGSPSYAYDLRVVERMESVQNAYKIAYYRVIHHFSGYSPCFFVLLAKQLGHPLLTPRIKCLSVRPIHICDDIGQLISKISPLYIILIYPRPIRIT